jgi:hypothetical protein
MNPTPALVTEEEKREALEKLLTSASFRRQEQLQRFLRYICDLEMAGRGSGIHEYQIGLDVFGKPDGYSTGEDPTVRSRAHTLRKKLQEYYATEAPNCPVRIDIPKGSYVPVFVRAADSGLAEPAPASAEPTPPLATRRRWPWLMPAGTFLAGALVTILAMVVWRGAGASAPAIAPLVREAWGPILSSASAKTVVFLASPAHLFVRRLPSDSVEIESSGRPLGRHELPNSAELREWYFGRYPAVPGTSPYLIPTHNSPLWGDAIGALTTVGLLARAGAAYEIVAERASTASALRDRNAVVFGRPEYSPAAEFLLSNRPMSIEYSNAAKEYVLKVACGTSPSKTYADSASQAGRPRDDDRYGIITLLSTDSPSGRTRVVHFSGLASAGTQAAAEYFSSAAQLRHLAAKFEADGFRGFPRSYQVLVRAKAIAMLPVQMEYVSHCVIEP